MTILICATKGYFADDVSAECATCQAPVVHRPHVPPDAVKVCSGCAAKRLARMERSATPFELRVTEDTRREVALYNATTKGTQ